jgi:hypothetical protein
MVSFFPSLDLPGQHNEHVQGGDDEEALLVTHNKLFLNVQLEANLEDVLTVL